MSKDEDYLLCMNHREGQDALDQLIKRHHGLAKKWAGKFLTQYSGCTLEDLIQECNRGIIDAAKRYDPVKGCFTTYATQWMRKRCLLLVDTRLKNTSTGNNQIPETVKKEELVEHCDSCGQLMIENDNNGHPDWLATITHLKHQQLINNRTMTIMKVICGDADQRKDTFRMLMANWWKATKTKAIRAVGVAQSKAIRLRKRRMKRRKMVA